jgi:hypothetical protein
MAGLPGASTAAGVTGGVAGGVDSGSWVAGVCGVWGGSGVEQPANNMHASSQRRADSRGAKCGNECNGNNMNGLRSGATLNQTLNIPRPPPDAPEAQCAAAEPA